MKPEELQKERFCPESIARRRAEVKSRLVQQRASLTRLGSRLFAPATPSSKIEGWVNLLHSGMALYDGFVSGLKLAGALKERLHHPPEE